jgi:hypothetical protein
MNMFNSALLSYPYNKRSITSLRTGENVPFVRDVFGIFLLERPIKHQTKVR